MNITNILLGAGILLFGAKTLLSSGKMRPEEITFSLLIMLAVGWCMFLIYRHQIALQKKQENEKFKEL